MATSNNSILLFLVIALSTASIFATPNVLSKNTQNKLPSSPIGQNSDAKNGESQSETFIPREPQEFKVQVTDGILGANQIREEKWDNGAVTGMYAQPDVGSKWRVVKYRADKEHGYQILSEESLSEDDLLRKYGAEMSSKNKAQIDVNNNGAKTSYSITPDSIKSNNKSQTPQTNQQKSSPNAI